MASLSARPAYVHRGGDTPLLGLTIDLSDGYTTMLVLAAGLQVIALVSFRDPVSARASARAATRARGSPAGRRWRARGRGR